MGTFYQTYLPHMAKKLKQEVTWPKQEVGSYLRNSLVERNGPKFGPSGLYTKHTEVRYDGKAQTGSHMAQTESWIISWKRSLVEQNGP